MSPKASVRTHSPSITFSESSLSLNQRKAKVKNLCFSRCVLGYMQGSDVKSVLMFICFGLFTQIKDRPWLFLFIVNYIRCWFLVLAVELGGFQKKPGYFIELFFLCRELQLLVFWAAGIKVFFSEGETPGELILQWRQQRTLNQYIYIYIHFNVNDGEQTGSQWGCWVTAYHPQYCQLGGCGPEGTVVNVVRASSCALCLIRPWVPSSSEWQMNNNRLF